MNKRLTIIAFVENSPGVLHRITTLFTKRKMNIESLTVSETHKKGLSRFTIVVNSDKALALKVAKQIRRIIEVYDVILSENEELVFSEIALIKVRAQSLDVRSRVEELAKRYNSVIASGGEDFLVIQKTGREEEIDALYLVLEPYDIQDFVRSGRIALLLEQNV